MTVGLFLNFIISMLAISNPAGSLAVFLGMTVDKTPEERRSTALIAAFTVFIVLSLMIWVGIPLLRAFSISLPAFQITGGLIILLRGLAMLNPVQSTSQVAAQKEFRGARDSVAIVPLAIPIIAGPGAMTNVIIFSRHFGVWDKSIICVGVLLVSIIIGAMLFFGTTISRLVGETSMKITTRIMGLLLAAIAMSMIVNGLTESFPGWS